LVVKKGNTISKSSSDTSIYAQKISIPAQPVDQIAYSARQSSYGLSKSSAPSFPPPALVSTSISKKKICVMWSEYMAASTTHTAHITAKKMNRNNMHQLGIVHKLTAVSYEKHLSFDSAIVIGKQMFTLKYSTPCWKKNTHY
jgi:hypothetical protein